jgi:hypothetical protein
MKALFLLVATLALLDAAAADEVYLKGGGKVSGRIVSRSATTIEVDVGAGRIGVPASSVERIEEGRSALQEFEERASSLPAGDVEGWLALGEWASARGLSSQAREAYNRVLSVSPGEPRANAALGNVQMDGRWMSEDESYRARGYIWYDGEWITADEHQRIQHERAAEAERDKARLHAEQAESRAREAEAKAAEAEAKAREAEAQQSSEGLPLWYGWGAGPVNWPTGPIVSQPIAPTRPVARPRAVPR